MESLEQKVDATIQMMREMHDQGIRCQTMTWRNLLQEVIVSTIWGSVIGYFLFRVLDHHFGAYHMPPTRRRKR